MKTSAVLGSLSRLAGLLALAAILTGCGVQLEPVTGADLKNYDRAEIVVPIPAADQEVAVLQQPSRDDSSLVSVLFGVGATTAKLDDLICLSGEKVEVRGADYLNQDVVPVSVVKNERSEKRTTFAPDSGLYKVIVACTIIGLDGKPHVVLRDKR